MDLFGSTPEQTPQPNDPVAQAAALRKQQQRQELLSTYAASQMAHTPQGSMAGRFYVPPSPVQGIGQLAWGTVAGLAKNRVRGMGLTPTPAAAPQPAPGLIGLGTTTPDLYSGAD